MEVTDDDNDTSMMNIYANVLDDIKDYLAISDKPIATLEELRKAAQTIDQRLRQRLAEKKGHSYPTSSPQGASADPNAMQVDATRQGQASADKKNRQTYIKFMNGKCFGCGSKDHSKKDGNHERDVCNHCGKVGHRSNVCFTKYLGKPGKTAKAGASVENPGTSSSTPAQAPPAQSASATKTTPAKDSTKQADVLAQLMEKVKRQEEELNALKASF